MVNPTGHRPSNNSIEHPEPEKKTIAIAVRKCKCSKIREIYNIS